MEGESVNRLAVNICDLSELTRDGGGFPTQILLQGFIDDPETVITDPRVFDSGVAVLNGPHVKDEKRLAGLVDLLHTVIGPRKLGRPVRLYEETSPGQWTLMDPKKELTKGEARV